MTTVTPRQIADKARELVDIRFVLQGRTREGMDCAGLIALTRTELGLLVVDVTNYARKQDLAYVRRFLGLNAKELPYGQTPLEGQVLLFMIVGVQPHLGIVVEPEWFVHTYESVGKVQLARLDNKWKARVQSVWELNGVIR